MSFGIEIKTKQGKISVRQDGYSMIIHRHIIGYCRNIQFLYPGDPGWFYFQGVSSMPADYLRGDYVTLPGWRPAGHKIALFSRSTVLGWNPATARLEKRVSPVYTNPWALSGSDLLYGAGLCHTYYPIDDNTIFITAASPDNVRNTAYHLLEFSYE